MGVSADETGIYIVEEDNYGVTPNTPSFIELPIVSDSLGPNASSSQSNTLNPNRQLLDSILTGIDVSGNIEVEMARTAAMDLVMESIFASNIDISGAPSWKLSVESVRKSFTLMKRWPDPNSAGFLYHIYKGCIVNSLSISMSAGSEVTASIGIIGKEADADSATVEPVGSTYASPNTFNVLRAPGVTQIALNDSVATLIGSECVTDMTLSMNGNSRGIQCLGTLGNKDTVLGRFESTLDMTVFFADNDIMESFLTQEIVDAAFTIGDDATEDHYNFVIPKGKIASNTVVAGGTGTDVVNSLQLQALIDDTLTPKSSVVMNTRVLT